MLYVLSCYSLILLTKMVNFKMLSHTIVFNSFVSSILLENAKQMILTQRRNLFTTTLQHNQEDFEGILVIGMQCIGEIGARTLLKRPHKVKQFRDNPQYEELFIQTTLQPPKNFELIKYTNEKFHSLKLSKIFRKLFLSQTC